MKAILSLLAVLVLLATIAEAQLYVPGYQHRDRTRVRPHKRTYHDGTIKAITIAPRFSPWDIAR